MLDRVGVDAARSVIDVGGGTSTLIDELLARGHRDVTVLDVSTEALARSAARVDSGEVTVAWGRR